MLVKKNKKNLICCDPVAAVFLIMMGERIYTFMTNFLEHSLSVSISSEIVWIDKLNYFYDGISFPNNDSHGNKKGSFSVIIATLATKRKLLQKLESYRFESPLQKSV